MTPKTIQIYLPSGEPHGIRVAAITTRIVQVIEVPRSLLQDFFKMPESNQVALYFLFGESEGIVRQKVYIGQTGNLRMRLSKHNKEKDFWQRVLILVSRTNSLTQTHMLFLEWHSIQIARQAGRYADQNGNSGSKPHTPPPLEADCLEIFETGRALLTTLGYPIFDAVRTPVASATAEEIFYCKALGVDGRGLYTPEGFVVMKGSIGRKTTLTSKVSVSDDLFRNALLVSGVLREEGDRVIFEKDHLFGSPSTAARALTGSSANGWTEWRRKDGRSLDAVKRQPSNGEIKGIRNRF